MFLAITESKKVIMGEGDDSQVSFEKHKIFLYKEDFQKFMARTSEASISLSATARTNISPAITPKQMKKMNGKQEEAREEKLGSEIKIDIEF